MLCALLMFCPIFFQLTIQYENPIHQHVSNPNYGYKLWKTDNFHFQDELFIKFTNIHF